MGLLGLFRGDSANVTLRRVGRGGGGGGGGGAAAFGGGGGVGNDIDGDGSDVSSLLPAGAVYQGLTLVCEYCCAPGRPLYSQSRSPGRNTKI